MVVVICGESLTGGRLNRYNLHLMKNAFFRDSTTNGSVNHQLLFDVEDLLHMQKFKNGVQTE